MLKKTPLTDPLKAASTRDSTGDFLRYAGTSSRLLTREEEHDLGLRIKKQMSAASKRLAKEVLQRPGDFLEINPEGLSGQKLQEHLLHLIKDNAGFYLKKYGSPKIRDRDFRTLVESNLRLAISIAKKWTKPGYRLEFNDMIQEANIGLMKAAGRFDAETTYKIKVKGKMVTKNVKFSTYASWWIQHALTRALADKGREIRLPVHMVDFLTRVKKIRAELLKKLTRPPTDEEVVDVLVKKRVRTDILEAKAAPKSKAQLKVLLGEKLVSLEQVNKPLISLHSPSSIGGEVEHTLLDVLPNEDKTWTDPTYEMGLVENTAVLRELLGELKPLEKEVLMRRFGMPKFSDGAEEESQSLKQIGDKHNLSRERIRQIQEAALEKMRQMMRRKGVIGID